MVTWPAVRAIEGMRVMAVAPLPITTTRLPVWSSSAGQCCGWITVPAKSSMPGNSGGNPASWSCSSRGQACDACEGCLRSPCRPCSAASPRSHSPSPKRPSASARAQRSTAWRPCRSPGDRRPRRLTLVLPHRAHMCRNTGRWRGRRDDLRPRANIFARGPVGTAWWCFIRFWLGSGQRAVAGGAGAGPAPQQVMVAGPTGDGVPARARFHGTAHKPESRRKAPQPWRSDGPHQLQQTPSATRPPPLLSVRPGRRRGAAALPGDMWRGGTVSFSGHGNGSDSRPTAAPRLLPTCNQPRSFH